MAGIRPLLIRTALILMGMLLVWLFAGRRISILLDYILTIRHASLRADPLNFENDTFWFGEMSLSIWRPDEQKSDLSVRTDESGQLVLTSGGHSFTLGRLAQAQESSTIPGQKIAPEPGDEVSLTIKRSIMSWSTPFEMNFMTGHSPSWKRHLYYHLQWKKRSGARLEMVWRYQQWYYGNLGGWASGMMTGPGTGMIACKIDDASGK